MKLISPNRRRAVTSAPISPRRSALAGILGLALTVPFPAVAASLDIPPQPLSTALVTLGRQANVQILYSPDLVQGVRAPALQGEMSVEQALQTLVRGTGLTFRIEGNVVTLARPTSGNVNPQSAAGTDAILLPGISVSAVAENIYGPVDGFVARRTATGTKTDTPLIEVPQSVSVVTRDQLVARNVQSDSEALLYTPGVFAQPFGGTLSQFNNFYRIRGFETAFGGSYVDGLVSPVNYRDEPYGIERYEILRGPTSVLYGQADPGGLINRTSKRPQSEAFGEGQLQYGSYFNKQFAFDVGGPADKDGQFLYRMTFMARNADAAVDYDFHQKIPDNRYYVAPSLTWKPTSNTSLTLLTSMLIDDVGQAVSYVQPNYKVTRIRLDQPGASDFNFRQYFIGYAFDHRFDDSLVFRQKFRYANMDYNYVSLAQLSINPPSMIDNLVDRSAFGFKEKRNDIVLDNHLQKTLTTGPIQHTILLGFDYQNLRDDVSFLSDFNISPIDIVSPNYSRISTALTTDQTQNSLNTNFGVYLQNQMKIADQWILTLGGRQDWNDAVITGMSAGTPIDQRQTDSAMTYRAGLTYLVTPNLAPYFSYTEAFLPTQGLDANLNPLKPTTGTQYELGIKYQPTWFKGNFTAAIYDLTKQNVVTTDPLTQQSSQTGEIRSRGLELEATANITEQLKMQGAYSLTAARVTKSLSGSQGEVPFLAPRHMASLWLDYKWDQGSLGGVSVGGGVRYISGTYAWDTDFAFGAEPRLRNHPYTLFDAAIRYDLGYANPKLKGVTLALNATNVADHRYQICYSRFDCQPGVPLTVMSSLSYKW